MKILTRKIRIEDAKFIHILSTQLGYKLSLAETISNIKLVMESKESCAFVATAERKIIGWIHVFGTIRIESPSFIEIGGMVVDADYSGKGAGRILVNKVKEWCMEQNTNILRVRCNSKRIEAHKFYSKIGFEETKNQKIFQMEIFSVSDPASL